MRRDDFFRQFRTVMRGLRMLVLCAALVFLCACESSSHRSSAPVSMRGSTVKEDSGADETSAGTGDSIGDEATDADNDGIPDDRDSNADSDVLGLDDRECIVVRLDTKEETISVLDMLSGRQVRFGYDLATLFLDEWGNICPEAEFLPGTMVVIGQVIDNNIREIRKSDKTWTVDDLTNYKIDLDREMLMIGQTKYRLRLSTPVFSGEDEVTVADIGEDDTLRVVGISKDILSVNITTGHGYIELVGTETFDDSLAQVGTKIFSMIRGDTIIEVPEGKHILTVAKDGWGGSKEVKVKRNATVTVDLESMKGDGPKYCTIKFDLNVEGARVSIDGERVEGNETKVTYGEHELEISADGYETWRKKIFANSPKATIALELTESEKNSASGGNNTNNNSGNNNSNNSNNNSNNR